jgi:hypothetical protein
MGAVIAQNEAHQVSIGPRSHFNARGLRATVRDGSGDLRFALPLSK